MDPDQLLLRESGSSVEGLLAVKQTASPRAGGHYLPRYRSLGKGGLRCERGEPRIKEVEKGFDANNAIIAMITSGEAQMFSWRSLLFIFRGEALTDSPVAKPVSSRLRLYNSSDVSDEVGVILGGEVDVDAGVTYLMRSLPMTQESLLKKLRPSPER